MPRGPTAHAADDLRFSAVWPFLAMAFGLAWGILALHIAWPERMAALFGELTGHHPLFILAVYAPAIAAFLLVALRGGAAGWRRYAARLLLWRCPRGWYAWLLLGLPLVFLGGALLRGDLGAWPVAPAAWPQLAAALVLTLFIGPVEEFGWRGLMLPLLQRRFAPIWAALMLGAIWGLWHLPAFLLAGTPQSAWSFTPFFAGAVAISVIVTPLFNASHGSIGLPAIFHFQLNNPLWPDAQPYDSMLLAGVAAVVVWLHRDTMFRRAGAVTVVIPPRGSRRTETTTAP